MQTAGMLIRTILFALCVIGIVLWTVWSLKSWDQQAPQTGLGFIYMLQAWSLVATPLALFALIAKTLSLTDFQHHRVEASAEANAMPHWCLRDVSTDLRGHDPLGRPLKL